MFGNKEAKYWKSTRAVLQAQFGEAGADMTDEELVDAILQSADNGDDDDDGDNSDKKEPEKKSKKAETEDEKADEEKADAADTKSEFAQLIAKIDLLANGQTDLGKRLTKIEAAKFKAATNGEREVEDTKGKPKFDSKKDAPVFVED